MAVGREDTDDGLRFVSRRYRDGLGSGVACSSRVALALQHGSTGSAWMWCVVWREAVLGAWCSLFSACKVPTHRGKSHSSELVPGQQLGHFRSSYERAAWSGSTFLYIYITDINRGVCWPDRHVSIVSLNKSRSVHAGDCSELELLIAHRVQSCRDVIKFGTPGTATRIETCLYRAKVTGQPHMLRHSCHLQVRAPQFSMYFPGIKS